MLTQSIEYKKRAMLWRAIRGQLLGMAALVALVCLGRQWGRAAVVGAAAVVRATLFAWLVNAFDLQWATIGYCTEPYRRFRCMCRLRQTHWCVPVSPRKARASSVRI